MYKVCAKVNDVRVKTAPLTPAFDLDVGAVLAAVDAHTKMVFICSPGNPTAKTIPNADVTLDPLNLSFNLTRTPAPSITLTLTKTLIQPFT